MNGQQPRPHDPKLMGWNELNDEQKKLFIEGCELFDEGKFWHAHESWEDLWKSLKPLGKPIETDAIQGIIQIAALLYNYERKKIRGVVNMASKLRIRLSGIEHGIWGVDVADLRVSLIPFIRDASETIPEWNLETTSVHINLQK
jgi:predicted metal-dependent hydrolase